MIQIIVVFCFYLECGTKWILLGQAWDKLVGGNQLELNLHYQLFIPSLKIAPFRGMTMYARYKN